MQEDEVGGDTEGTPLQPALNFPCRCFMQLVDTERSAASSPSSPPSLTLSPSPFALSPPYRKRLIFSNFKMSGGFLTLQTSASCRR